jgi:hypothetical protein
MHRCGGGNGVRPARTSRVDDVTHTPCRGAPSTNCATRPTKARTMSFLNENP